MKTKILTCLLTGCVIISLQSCNQSVSNKQSVIFYSYADNPDEVHYLVPMVQSLRTFAGKYKDAAIWIYMKPELREQESSTIQKLISYNVVIKDIEIPAEADWFFLSGIVYTAARAESEAAGKTDILVFLNWDTVFLNEPDEFNLPAGKKLGYRPVMHKNVGLLFSEPLDSFWTQIYKIMAVDESALFPMVTPADGDTIRPYFNAGLLVIRPEGEILRKWAEYYERLYSDTLLRKMCEMDVRKRIFLHQTALTGAILNNLTRNEIIELSDRYNYPIFFREQFGAKKDFHDITRVITFRHESWFSNPDPDWDKKLTGPPEKIDWIKEHLIFSINDR
jgi:hypothetical protein